MQSILINITLEIIKETIDKFKNDPKIQIAFKILLY